jgi:two-component system response regulator RegA
MNDRNEIHDLPSLLLADDDRKLVSVLGRALEKKGYRVTLAHGYESALDAATEDPPAYAVIDLKLHDGLGLSLIRKLLDLRADMRIVVVTSYGSIATALEAVRLGAHYYLTKPAGADDIVAALLGEPGTPPALPYEKPLSVYRLAWEHINRVLIGTNGNITAAARELGMHRRTLQRKLNTKHPIRS